MSAMVHKVDKHKVDKHNKVDKHRKWYIYEKLDLLGRTTIKTRGLPLYKLTKFILSLEKKTTLLDIP